VRRQKTGDRSQETGDRRKAKEKQDKYRYLRK
jgi:hypothetical protein